MSKREKETITLREALSEIYIRIAHLEDIEADNRELIIKSIKQNNQIIKFLASVSDEAEAVEVEISNKVPSLPFDSETYKSESKWTSIKELVEDFIDRHDELKELEKELKKSKGDITPGQVGEA